MSAAATTTPATPQQWQSISISGSGQYITAVEFGGYIYTSSISILGGFTGGTVSTPAGNLAVIISGVTYYLQLYSS